MKQSTISFYDFHKPVLEDGEYQVEITQNIKVKDNGALPVSNPSIPSQKMAFHVSGPRFDLDPGLIHSTYPPNGAKGDYMASLPSLVLSRNTLPWERSPGTGDSTDNSASWLFLLLVDETESSKVKEQNTVDLNGLASLFVSPETGRTPLTLGDLSRLPAKINYLEVDSALSSFFPATLEDLQYLSYTRTKEAGEGNDIVEKEEHAVLLCNRLPQRGKNSTVYLISLENNYQGTGRGAEFAGIKNSEEKLIFPYLYKWQFHTFDDQLYCITKDVAAKIQNTYPEDSIADLGSLYDHLYENTDDFTKALETLNITDKTTVGIIEKFARLPGATFHELLFHLTNGFKPFSLDSQKNDITVSGTVTLAFNKVNKTQNSERAVYSKAWYRGPLAACPVDLSGIDSNFPLKTNGSNLEIPSNASDLILLDSTGAEDLTYAAAYELGRLSALNDVDFSTEFFKWKTETATAIRLHKWNTVTGYKSILHLPLNDKALIKPMPQHVQDTFNAWRNLKGIPYRYLVPDAGLCPNESIRFFQIDNNWVNAFLCGAFSIGHTVEADLSAYLKSLFLNSTVSGFLINSFAVSGWPDFEVDALTKEGQDKKVTSLRTDNLDKNIRIYLYPGTLFQLNFHLHPGKMHFGFLYEDEKFTKNGGNTDLTDSILENRVINLPLICRSELFDTKPPMIAEFAAKMMEGIPDVEFQISTES